MALVSEHPGIPLNAVQREAFNRLNELVYDGTIAVEKVRSCFCGSAQFERLTNRDRFGLPFGTQICRHCGLISQTIRISERSMARFYEEIYWPLVTGRSHYSTPHVSGDPASMLVARTPSEWRIPRIFEIGCGDGTRLRALREAFGRVGRTVEAIGCDYSSEAVRRCAANGVDARLGGMETLSTLGRADIVVLSHVFEHLTDLRQAMIGMQALTHPNSLIYVEVPGVVDLENKPEYDFNYQTYCVVAHTYTFSLSTLTAVLASGGFQLVAGDEYVHAIFTPGVDATSTPSAYSEVISALKRADAKHRRLAARRHHPVARYARNALKALLGRQ